LNTSLTRKLRGTFVKVSELPNKVGGTVVASFITKENKDFIVVRTKPGELVNFKLNQKSISNLLTLGIETIEQLHDTIVYFKKETWADEYSQEHGEMMVLYGCDRKGVKLRIPEAEKE